eukprot:gene7310-14904_t
MILLLYLVVAFTFNHIGEGSIQKRLQYKNPSNIPQEFLHELVNMAEISSLCNSNEISIKNHLHQSRLDIEVTQRRILSMGLQYNILRYKDNTTGLPRIILSFRGTKSLLNLRGLMDSRLAWDDMLAIHMHSGVRAFYRAILDDICRYTFDCPVSLTGHSMGGVLACALGAAGRSRLQWPVQDVTVFGMPMFTDEEGCRSPMIAPLPLIQVRHKWDPVCIGYNEFAGAFTDRVGPRYRAITAGSVVVLGPNHGQPAVTSSLSKAAFPRQQQQRGDGEENGGTARLVSDSGGTKMKTTREEGPEVVGTGHTVHLYRGQDTRDSSLLEMVGDLSRMHLKYHSMRNYLHILQSYE